MGIGRARAVPTGVPKGFEVAVEYQFGIAHHGFFGAGIGYLPIVRVHQVALAVEQFDFGEAGVQTIVRGEHLDAEVAQRGGGGKIKLLETGFLLHLTREDYVALIENRLAHGFALGSRALVFIHAEGVENGLGQTGNAVVAGGFEVEHDDLVLALLHPRSGHVERVLRADGPILADAAAVYPHRTFAPAARVEEEVAGGGQFECATIESGGSGGKVVFSDIGKCLLQLLGGFALVGHGSVEGQRRGGPTRERLAAEGYLFCDAFEVVEEVGAIVHAANVFNQYLEFAAGGNVYVNLILTVATVEAAHNLAVNGDNAVVAQFLDDEHAFGGSGERGFVVDIAKVHVGIFHGEGTLVLNAAREGSREGCLLREGDGGESADGVEGGHVGERFALGQVLLDDFAEGVALPYSPRGAS